MIITFIDRLIQREGGFVDHPADRGGPTNAGITLKTLISVWPESTVETLKNLTLEEKRFVYRREFWDGPGFNKLGQLADPVEEFLFDAGVHHGPYTVIKMLQRALGLTPDGVLGPKTIAAVTALPQAVLLAHACDARAQFMARIVEKDPSQACFIEGWLKRVGEFIRMIPPLANRAP